ncbi:hypothetical protein [Ramlibacter rhizophilus]|uniref:Uncharacterized protein n=1 Tax=Ramlibacter rhizophilus TaxID=1781167 RepID=A0A4Z0BQE1_9BURK|nr:hypothetical protein [Ramlibacter rhizophilus]TFZ01061.1 hypothetical protein EZ242_06610 [Ramlibacter rhizophilus]
MALPWGVLVANLPTLIDAAGKLFKRADAPPRLPEVQGSAADQIEALTQRLAYYERLEAEQAQLLKQTIEQLQQMAVKAAASETRANIALGVAAVSVLVAVVALVVR